MGRPGHFPADVGSGYVAANRVCTHFVGRGAALQSLADLSDPTTWTTQAGFGLEEGIYMILTGPTGDTIT